jgi:thiamine-monophosphate kinase
MVNEMQIIDLIRGFFSADQASSQGFYDDILILSEAGDLALKADMFVAETDMPPGMTLPQASRKAVVSCLSDLAAKGAKPIGYIMSMGIPRRLSHRREMTAILDGMKRANEEYSLRLLAGDVNESRELVLDCVMYGLISHSVTRAGAKPGDIILSTDPFGYTGLGLRHVTGRLNVPPTILDDCLRSILEPHPNFALSSLLVSSGFANASMDSSDGLASTLHEIAEQSGVCISVDSLPIEEKLAKEGLPEGILFQSVFYGGEEFAAVISVPEMKMDQVDEMARRSGKRVYRIGRVLEGRGVKVNMGKGWKPLKKAGWVHLGRHR